MEKTGYYHTILLNADLCVYLQTAAIAVVFHWKTILTSSRLVNG